MIGGVLLGLGGTTFAVGVPAVNAWFPPANRGIALGVFGIGTGGTAVASVSTLPLANAFGPLAPFVVVSLALVVVAVLAWALLGDPADRVVPPGSALHRTVETLRLAATWELSVLYALTFGGFVAFSVYLPTYLKSAYDLSASDASMRTAGFVVLAVVARPVGGWLCDRVHPASVLGVACSLAMLFAILAAFELPLAPLGTIAFLGLAAVLGAGAGAVFALVAKLAPADEVGAVTGLVGAAGGPGRVLPAAGDGRDLRLGWRLQLGFRAPGVGRSGVRGADVRSRPPGSGRVTSRTSDARDRADGHDLRENPRGSLMG
ncbi:MFS transporter [Saccharopolyspora pogona]|uniref:MFS transporter n=1 Tax=Saccharopolyspora pogona TaxID=333966 RepID=UPI0021E00C5B|nr:MFS transporter [Saccharopolyspora pogona]